MTLAALAPRAQALVRTAEGRRRATRAITERCEHIPGELLAHQVGGIAGCAAAALIDHALEETWPLAVQQITCPMRIVWVDADRLLPWPTAAARFRASLPHADWVVPDGVGHCPQLDVPLEAAELVLGVTAARRS